MSTSETDTRIVNCHTHIFTGDHVPPYLAKSFAVWPLYYLAHVPTILKLFKFFNTFIEKQEYKPNSIFNKVKRMSYRVYQLFRSYFILKVIWFIVALWLTIYAFFKIFFSIERIFPAPDGVISEKVKSSHEFLVDNNLLIEFDNALISLLVIVFVFLFFKLGRNLIVFILKNIWKVVKIVPGKQSRKLIERYILLGRFTLYKNQAGIFSKLKSQYPPGTSFVILPMDMEYMNAGKAKISFYDQMGELAQIKEADKNGVFHPFVFIDPRRITDNENPFLDFKIEQNKVILKDCFVQKYIEEYKFSGFKIYPSLGYYPFDEKLLPLWKYAADNELPVMTHCIRGTIFYRGTKKKDWDRHPVFRETKGDGIYEPMLLSEKKNIDFANNFTHPLNYLCLLYEPLLRILVSQAKDQNVKKLFGYTSDEIPLEHDLSHLKFCFAHFGGDDQWEKYLEMDRYPFAQDLIKNRSMGINFLNDKNGIRWGLLEQVYKYVDWYTIICSLMNQYVNVYADISYVLASPRIFPLLKETLSSLNPTIRNRVLFGTDFYVVRNHHSDKDLLAETLSHLSEEEFDLIARKNPVKYLTRKTYDFRPPLEDTSTVSLV